MIVGRIYGLVSSEQPDVVRYVGKTTRSLERRLSSHRTAQKSERTRKSYWMNSVYKRGYEVFIIELCSVTDPTIDLSLLEKEWIEKYKAMNIDLVNTGWGGGGRHHKSPEKCTWKDCDNEFRCSNLCEMHYKRQRDGRDMDAPVRPRPSGFTGCRISSCSRRHRRNGLCKTHADRLDVGTPFDAPIGWGRSVNQKGKLKPRKPKSP